MRGAFQVKAAALFCGALIALSAVAQETATAPAAAAPDESQRIERFVGLIEGANPPQARLTGALELLRDPSPAVIRRLTGILSGGNNRAAKIAIAQGIAGSAATVKPEFVQPLLAMLSDVEDGETRSAAAAALATSTSDATVEALKELAKAEAGHVSVRLAAVDALGRMTQRSAIGALIDVLSTADPTVQRAGLTALQNNTAQNFRDLNAARNWWEETRSMSLEEWQRLQINRLVAQNRATQQRTGELESRLSVALRDALFRAPESERPVVLTAYLGDPMTSVRIAGLDLVRSLLTDGKSVPPEVIGQVRNLLTATDPAIRLAAVRALAAVRDPDDASRLAAMLEGERIDEVRQAIVAALGFVGGQETIGTLLRVLESGDRVLLGEAIVSLGRIAERLPIEGATRDAVVKALLARFSDRSPDALAPRDAVLRAMTRIGDVRFVPSMIQALAATESPAARQAAARGIASFAEPKPTTTGPANGTDRRAALAAQGVDIDALAAAVSEAVADPDPGVRKAATDALAAFGSTDAHLATLWSRLAPSTESDESVRESAWRGVLRMLASRPPAEANGWIARLPETGAPRARRALDLLQLMEKSLAAKGPSEELADLRVRIAEQRLALQQASDAVGAYLSSVETLREARSPRVKDVLLDLLRAALRHDAYDSRVAAALRAESATLPPAEVWKAIRAEAEPLVERDTIDRAVALLASLMRNLPFAESDEQLAALTRLHERAREIQVAADLDAVTAALAALRSDPQDSAARQRIEKLGARAVPPLRTALEHELGEGEAAPGKQERLLHDLLKLVVPSWPGFEATASLEDKRRSLEMLDA